MKFLLIFIIGVLLFVLWHDDNELKKMKQANQVMIDSLRKNPEALFIMVDGKEIKYIRYSAPTRT